MSAQVESMVRVLRQIASYLKTIDHACVYEIEDYEDGALVANFYTSGFDGFMLSEIRDIARKNGCKADFCVGPYGQKTVKLTLVIGVEE